MILFLNCTIALAIYSRSLAAFKALRSLKILNLPCEQSMKTHMNCLRKEEGVNEDDLRYSAKKYEEHKRTLALEGKHLHTGEGVLIWDETKVSF